MNITDNQIGNKRTITLEVNDLSFDDKVSLLETLQDLVCSERDKIQLDYLNQFSCSNILEIIKDSYATEGQYAFLMSGNFADVISELTGDTVKYNVRLKQFIVKNPSVVTSSCIQQFWDKTISMDSCHSIKLQDTIEMINQHVKDDLDYDKLRKFVFIY